MAPDNPRPNLILIEGLFGEWLAWVSALATQLPWLQHRDLHGPHGWTTFVMRWAAVLPQLYDDVPFSKLRLLDANQNRAAADRAVDTHLGYP